MHRSRPQKERTKTVQCQCMPKTEETNDNNDNDKQNEPSLGTYGNGWSEDGRKRYCKLMKEANESRAFYKESFNKQMKKSAKYNEKLEISKYLINYTIYALNILYEL